MSTTPSPHDAVMDAAVASLAAKLPNRYVQRKLVDPAQESPQRLGQGVICLASAGGGAWANWQGREGELGTMKLLAVGFVSVAELRDATSEDVERAEFELLQDLLEWCQDVKAPPLDSVYPGDYRQSQQLEFPVGWLALELQVRNV